MHTEPAPVFTPNPRLSCRPSPQGRSNGDPPRLQGPQAERARAVTWQAWFTGDGLLMHYATELLAGVCSQRDPRNAVKLYHNLTSSAWARLPPAISSKYGLRMQVLYEKHVCDFVVEALQDGGHKMFAARVLEERKKPLPPPPRPKPPPTAAPARPVASPPDAKESSAAASGVGGKGGGGSKATRPAGEKALPAPRQAKVAASAASAAAKEFDDADVARAMLIVLRKAHAPLSFAHVASEAKSAHPSLMWNLARWLQAVQRGLRARPHWFVRIGAEMLGVGPEAGVEPEEPASTAPAAASAAH